MGTSHSCKPYWPNFDNSTHVRLVTAATPCRGCCRPSVVSVPQHSHRRSLSLNFQVPNFPSDSKSAAAPTTPPIGCSGCENFSCIRLLELRSVGHADAQTWDSVPERSRRIPDVYPPDRERASRTQIAVLPWPSLRQRQHECLPRCSTEVLRPCG